MRSRLFAVAFAAVIALGVGGEIANVTHHATHTGCVVTAKDRVRASQGAGSNMRVYTSCGQFEVKDTLGHWDSADRYGSLVPGETYTLKTRGYRVPILSAFPIILEVKQ